MVKPGDIVIDNKHKKVIGIVTAIDSNKNMAQIYRYDLNEYKPPLNPSIYIYQPFDSIDVKQQSGGSGSLYKNEHDNEDYFHIIDVNLDDGNMHGLYGYFKDGYLEFNVMHPLSEGSNKKIGYDVINDIIIGTEFQDIINTSDDIERSQLADVFLNKVKNNYNVVKFSLNQTNIANTTLTTLKKDITNACRIEKLEGIFNILITTQLRKKTGNFQITTNKRIDTFIKNLTMCIGGGCEKRKLKKYFNDFCDENSELTNKITGEFQLTLNTPVDKIIDAFLPDKNTLKNITLLKNVTYTENNIGLDNGSELGKLFNMKYDINEKYEITTATLSYNLIGFLMLMTELDHDFNDVKEIKPHLPIINKNFFNVATLMKDKLINIGNRTEALQKADSQLFNKIFDSLDKENPKLKEEEMGRIITALLCNDDMPRVIAADDKVYLQYYAPKSLKGNMPAFYNMRQINEKNKEEVNEMERFLEYTFNNEVNNEVNNDNKMSFEEFKFIRDISKTNLETQKEARKTELNNKREEEEENKSPEEKEVINIKYNSLIKASNEKYDIFIGLQTKYKNSYVNTKSVFDAYDNLKKDVEEKIESIDNQYDASYKEIKDKYDEAEKDINQSSLSEEDNLNQLTQLDKDVNKEKNDLFTEYSRDIKVQNTRLTDVNQLLELDGITEDVNGLVVNFNNKSTDANPFMEDIMTFYNTDINFTSDADNKAAYVLANSKNMKPITKEKHPFLSLDAGSSPQLPINNEYYDWFNRLHNEHKQDPINPPTIVVKNPLDGSELVTITYNGNKMYDLLIRVTEELKIEETIKDLNKTSMSRIMLDAITQYNAHNGEQNYQLLLFGASILKSLGDLVCYITVNMQEFLTSKAEDQKENMYLCNSADYSMYYPLLGNFSFNEQNEIAKKYNKTNMYLSCSIKSMQNFFVPLTQHEQIKLYLIKLLYTENPKGFQVLEEVLSFEEKYGRPGSFANKTIYNAAKAAKDSNYGFDIVEHQESIALFTIKNYEAFKAAYQGEGKNSFLYVISEMYLVFVYLSKLYYFREDKEVGILQGILQDSALLHQLKVLNRDIFQEHTFDLQNTRRQLERLDLVADYKTDNKGLVLSANNRMRRNEILESFLLKEEVQFTDVEINRDSWKYSYLYATILKKVGDSDIIYKYLNDKEQEKGSREEQVTGDNFPDNAVKEGGEEEEEEGGEEEEEEEEEEESEENQGAAKENPGGKRRNKSKKNGKKSNKRQTRKANK